MNNEKMWAFADEHNDELLELIKTLCGICAPSHQEEKRTQFVSQWLKEHGAENVEIDCAGNVLFFYQCDQFDRWLLASAHMDTVFPDLEPMPLKIEGDRIYCPGVGDDTANLAVLMMTAYYLCKEKPQLNKGLLLAADTGEEGLGNLYGIRQVMADHGEHIDEMLALDGTYDGIVNKAVGSLRYEVSVDTEGGHSYACFGNRNAIEQLSKLIEMLYAYQVPSEGKTTYNVGVISGGTSVNTIAQHARMLFEIRSDVQASMEQANAYFHQVIELMKANGTTVSVKLLGERPCMGKVDMEKQTALETWAKELIHAHTGQWVDSHSGSTDCNIPFSMGIPSVCFGTYLGQGAHTREEYVEISSLSCGLRLGMDALLKDRSER